MKGNTERERWTESRRETEKKKSRYTEKEKIGEEKESEERGCIYDCVCVCCVV